MTLTGLVDDRSIQARPRRRLDPLTGELFGAWEISAVARDGLPRELWVREDGTVLSDTVVGELAERERTFHMDGIYPPGLADPPARFDAAYTLVYDVNPPDPTFWLGGWPGSTYHAALGTAWTNYYLGTRHGRDGWDADSSVSRPFNTIADVNAFGVSNAAWIPATFESILSGVPNVVVLGSQAACNDIVGHEYMHAMLFDELGLPLGGPATHYSSIEEALGDMQGQLVEAMASGSTDWLVGTGGTCSVPLRNMASPEGACHTCTVPYLGTSHFANYGRSFGSATYGVEYSGALMLGFASHLLGRPAASAPITHAGLSVAGVGTTELSYLTYPVAVNRVARTDDFTDFANHWKNEAYLRWGAAAPETGRAINAVDAVGLWTGSFYTAGPETTSRMAIASASVLDEDRTYIVYRSAATPDRLVTRYRTCALYDSCAWSTPQALSWTAGAPAVAAYGGSVWVFHRYDLNTSLMVRRLSSAGTWSVESLPGSPQSDTGVAAVEFNGALYVFFRPASGGGTLSYFRRVGSTWTGPTELNTVSHSAPAVAVVGDRLYLAYRRGTGTANLYYRSMSTALSWTTESVVPNQSGYNVTAAVGDPTVTAFRGRLHVAARDANGAARYSSFCPSGTGCTYRVSDWTMTVRHAIGANGDPTLYSDAGVTEFGQMSYLMYPQASGVWYDYRRSE